MGILSRMSTPYPAFCIRTIQKYNERIRKTHLYINCDK